MQKKVDRFVIEQRNKYQPNQRKIDEQMLQTPVDAVFGQIVSISVVDNEVDRSNDQFEQSNFGKVSFNLEEEKNDN